MSSVTEGGEGLWIVPTQSVVPLGRRSHAAHSAAEVEELDGEAPSAQAIHYLDCRHICSHSKQRITSNLCKIALCQFCGADFARRRFFISSVLQ